MCDTLVALPGVTRDKNVLFAKSADCEVNEANAFVRIPHRKHVKGEAVRITHLTIPQAEETYELLLTKAWWTYGCEVGVNEYGLAMGEEAVFTTDMAEDEGRHHRAGPDAAGARAQPGLPRSHRGDDAAAGELRAGRQRRDEGQLALRQQLPDGRHARSLHPGDRRAQMGGEEDRRARLDLQHARHHHRLGALLGPVRAEGHGLGGHACPAGIPAEPGLADPPVDHVRDARRAARPHHQQDYLRDHAPARRRIPSRARRRRIATCASTPGRRRTAGGRPTA